MSSVRVRRLDVDAVLARLRRYATELGERPEVRRVILIGSLAKGTWSASSDADVVVLVDERRCSEPGRAHEYAPRQPLGIGVDLFVRTPLEVEAVGPRFAAEVEAGIVLFDRER